MAKSISELMTRQPICCHPEDNIREIAKKMAECDCGAIPIVDQNDKPVGIITDRDIVTRAIAQGKNPLEMECGDCMTSQIQTVRDNADLKECLQKMEANQIRRMIVLDENERVCGIVAQADLARNEREYAGEVVEEVSQPR